MSDRIWTIIIMAVCTVVLIGWDIYVAFFNSESNRRDTISGVLLGWSKSIWFLPYAFGVLGGHLFWPGSYILEPVTSVLVLAASALALTGLGILARKLEYKSAYHAVVLLPLGFVMGHLLWPQ